MGQYYRPTIVAPDGRIMSLDTHTFDSGAKLTEHSWISNELVNAAYSLILDSPKRVAWIGDYALDPYDRESDGSDTSDYPYIKAMTLETFQPYYDSAWGEESQQLDKKLFSKKDLNILNHNTTGMYLVNHTKQVYINLETYIYDCSVKGGTWDGWCMNPLPLLTACGNGQGGGDYHDSRSSYEDIGIWAFDSLEYTDTVSDGFSEVSFRFFDN